MLILIAWIAVMGVLVNRSYLEATGNLAWRAFTSGPSTLERLH